MLRSLEAAGREASSASASSDCYLSVRVRVNPRVSLVSIGSPPLFSSHGSARIAVPAEHRRTSPRASSAGCGHVRLGQQVPIFAAKVMKGYRALLEVSIERREFRKAIVDRPIGSESELLHRLLSLERPSQPRTRSTR